MTNKHIELPAQANISTAPAMLNMNDKAMWVIGWNECLAAIAAHEQARVVGEPVAWPTMPPSKGQSPVLFEDGYAEGWAKCMALCREAVAASLPAPKAVQADDMVSVPLEFLRGFHTLAHNYSLRAVPPDCYQGVEGDAFSNAYRRCGEDLAKLRAIVMYAAAPSPDGKAEHPLTELARNMKPMPADIAKALGNTFDLYATDGKAEQAEAPSDGCRHGIAGYCTECNRTKLADYHREQYEHAFNGWEACKQECDRLRDELEEATQPTASNAGEHTVALESYLFVTNLYSEASQKIVDLEAALAALSATTPAPAPAGQDKEALQVVAYGAFKRPGVYRACHDFQALLHDVPSGAHVEELVRKKDADDAIRAARARGEGKS